MTMTDNRKGRDYKADSDSRRSVNLWLAEQWQAKDQRITQMLGQVPASAPAASD